MVVFDVDVAPFADVRAVAGSFAFNKVVEQVAVVIAHHWNSCVQVLVVVVVECDFVAQAIAVAVADEAAFMVVVEVVPAEGRVVDVVLGVQQAVVAVLVFGSGVIEFAVVYPNIVAALLAFAFPVGDGGIGGNCYAVRVVQHDFGTVAECDDLVFVGLADRHVAHRELDVPDDDIVLVLDG